MVSFSRRSAKLEAAHQALHLRIFLASPGDVCDERGLARAVIEQIRSERAFRGHLDLECIVWDQPGESMPRESALTPREAIARGLPKPSQCDIFIAIFWSRVGAALPPDPDYEKPNGTRYLSGAEWEFQDAVRAYKQRGRPYILLFHRIQVPNPAFEDPEYYEKWTQWQQVKDFFETIDREDESITGSLNLYTTPDEFRRQLEQHLRDLLTRLLDEHKINSHITEIESALLEREAPRWERAPYPGLEVFIPEQSPIFFGRGRETDQLLAVLTEPKTRFIAVVGASGVGKSSLVAGGLIPRLRAGASKGSDHWRYLTFRPGERGHDPFLALAHSLEREIGGTGDGEKYLANRLRKIPDLWEKYVHDLLRERPPQTDLLIFIDQFEELFTVVNPELCKPFIEFLERSAVQVPRIQLLVTIRADFYAQALEFPRLAALLRDRGTFTLSTPDLDALREMIMGPAKLAGLELENSLIETILTDTGNKPGSLPLMAFALHELYEVDKARGRLSLDSYKAIGGVKDALRKRADDTLGMFRGGQKNTLEVLFASLANIDEHGVVTRKRATLSELRRNRRTAEIVEALCNARILIKGIGENNQETVEVTHEVVFKGWARLRRWIEDHRVELEASRELEKVAQAWKEAGEPKWNNLASGQLLQHYRRSVNKSPAAKRFLNACLRLRRVRRSLLSLLACVTLGASFWWWISNEEMSVRVGLGVLLARLNVYTLQPEMVAVPGGRFIMGSPEAYCDRLPNECPQREVVISKSFLMGKYEVTFDEYEVFFRVTNYKGSLLPHNEGWGRGRRPIINVSWEDAQKYVHWLREKTNKNYRLPSEAEWEYAARAGTKTTYWWGNEMNQDSKGNARANCGNCGSQWDNKQTAPVGSFAPNPFGLYDMLGNVWEWVQDCWHDNYLGAPTDGSAWGLESSYHCGKRVLRGGSWNDLPIWVRSAGRFGGSAGDSGDLVGFRLVQDIN